VSTSPTIQVDPASVDVAGLSIATATPSASNPRLGSVYDPVTWAAAAPIWLHPMADGRFLMACARRWHDAVPVAGGYTSFTEDLSPSWCVLDGPTGRRSTVPDSPISIPMRTATGSAVLTAGASRPPGNLYLLNAVTIAGSPQAVLQSFQVRTNGSVVLVAEELLPTATVGTETVIFDHGLQYDTPYLVVYGADFDGNLYRLRKPWGRVGVNKRTQVTPQDYGDVVGMQVGWEFYGNTGYSFNPTELSALTAATGAWTSQGPLSFAAYRGQVLATTVLDTGGTITGQQWISNKGRPFTKTGFPVALGSTSDGSYLGGGIQLQAQLGANPAASAMTGSVLVGFPYCTWTKSSSAGVSSLNVAWDLWTVE
jgi:hypothetical protein